MRTLGQAAYEAHIKHVRHTGTDTLVYGERAAKDWQDLHLSDHRAWERMARAVVEHQEMLIDAHMSGEIELYPADK